MADTLTKLTYQTFQQSKNYFGLAHKILSTRVMSLVSPSDRKSKPLPLDLLQKINQRYERLLEVDWQDAEAGVYPHNILFDNPWDEFFLYYPAVWFDLPQIWERAKQKNYQDFDSNLDIAGYPSYYLQNFHHQTGGYLSDLSANLYDLQVEILFGGSADAMRRRILASLKQGLSAFDDVPASQIKILDIACGTGRTLKMIRAALPKAALFGTDLSPAYLRKANQMLSQIPGELPQLLQANAEELPYMDNYFHATTSVFLFHELPAVARQRVIEEAFRVTKPGGRFIICDSIQMSDSPEMEPAMTGFYETFHEPYYRHYMTDDLVERLEKAGFENVTAEVQYMSKVLVACKPV
ncbi:MAG: 2-methoxy-6-polyprenyl-1,4-benzoquinol methylase, mitochondrial [Chroococcidiopsis cubana SAG 39.79]|jgi:ubiquinone/menaquinone biosynthesis C-methylase UbiE|uniref:Methyltransferase n=1 Tax=Chroococcidiopsis cubana SAG 39.79 TaxID=388085 RepID=A0AB37UJC9_9CYAN|nr:MULTISPECIES: class I SAM-dependent methyltransferase [Chroococcidiopsis]MDZ4876264.1 2-methoxy-6-polyprenyl-1,4-benzoquinol methylase, mitochondrial [Chroococcidiopsis cubana SAG 39.79]PSB59402.1 SAM-dependent methyltransferase [Chroococcidiopsis cubana CCALA 043]RUT11472.1 methyltransferase [Chroococcidiopsis cubana SAG 39.79]URD49509.1 methyltransferase domain-containing protein [Chroococcidiopsis sp. CCNUC1]